MNKPLMRRIVVVATLLIGGAGDTDAEAKRPNIVFILIDDLRYDTFGFMDHPFIKTPHIDALARHGLRFTNAFVTTSLCSPARASFLSGRFMHNHRVVSNSDPMPAGTVTFPQLLRQAGYQTAFVGKWHMGGASDAPRPGFDHWVSFHGQGTYAPAGQTLNVDGHRVPRRDYITDELTDYATEWIAQRDGSRPFLMYLSHKGVHGPYEPAARHRDRYQSETFVRPATMARTTKDHSGKPMWVQDQRNSWHGVEFPYHGRANLSIETMYKRYCEMILSIDDSVGRIISTLTRTGVVNDTLVMFTSDGGHLWGEHGLIDKRCGYEASIRIPLLAAWPATIKPASTCGDIVANIDIAPTLLELARVAIPTDMDGLSFGRRLSDPDTASPTRSALLYEYYWEPAFPQTPTMFVLRDARYKLIQYHGIWDSDELYDLQLDPDEQQNLILAAQQQTRVAKMRADLHQGLAETGGLVIPLGFKRNLGANLRSESGSKRARFPEHMISPN